MVDPACDDAKRCHVQIHIDRQITKEMHAGKLDLAVDHHGRAMARPAHATRAQGLAVLRTGGDPDRNIVCVTKGQPQLCPTGRMRDGTSSPLCPSAP